MRAFTLADYTEPACETQCVSCCGCCWCVVLGLLALTWVLHSIALTNDPDVPPFARTVMWMSLAYHTDAWRDWRAVASSPPSMPVFE